MRKILLEKWRTDRGEMQQWQPCAGIESSDGYSVLFIASAFYDSSPEMEPGAVGEKGLYRNRIGRLPAQQGPPNGPATLKKMESEINVARGKNS
jgi:hypothetical protein